MPLQSDLSSLIHQLAKKPLAVTSRFSPAQMASQPAQDSLTAEADQVKPISRKAFSGSGLSLELTLSSGQSLDLNIRINQAGGVSQLELVSDSQLSSEDEERLKSFFSELSSGVEAIFSGASNLSQVFNFANWSGIEDIDLSVYQDDGQFKQAFEFEKQQGIGSRRQLQAQWYEYDREKGLEENHDFNLTKQAKSEKQASIYGSMNYQWLFEQVNSAMSVLEDKQQGEKLASFFRSGIQALFATANSGSRLLQELGASAEGAKNFIGRSIKLLTSDNLVNKHHSNQQKQMNALPDFTMAFSSQRKNLTDPTNSAGLDNAYRLDMTLSQKSDQAYSSARDESYQSQNRRLRMNYQSQYQQAIYEYSWTRDESIRHVLEDSKLVSSHYRFKENQQEQLLAEGHSQKRVNQDREDKSY